MPSFLDRVRSFDAAPKIEYDFLQRTSLGACVSLVSVLLMVVLFVSEVGTFFTPVREHELVVDVSRGDTFRINFDVTFPRLPCSLVALDVENADKQAQVVDMHEVFKMRLNLDGSTHADSDDQLVKLGGTMQSHDDVKAALNGSLVDRPARADADDDEEEKEPADKDGCGSCYGAGEPGECCSTCGDIRNAYRKKGWAFALETTIELCKQERVQHAIENDNKEGCRVKGHVAVPLADGNLHFAPSRDIEHARMPWEQVVSYAFQEYDLSHNINSFSVGPQIPSAQYPLAGVSKTMNMTEDGSGDDSGVVVNLASGHGSGMYQYYLKVVPTDYERKHKKQATFQYAATEHFRHLSTLSSNGMPGVYFYFEVSPIRMLIRETGSSFGHFVTNICAIIGGTFTVMGMVDGLLHALSQDGSLLAGVLGRRSKAGSGLL